MNSRRALLNMAFFSWIASRFGAAEGAETKFNRIEDLRQAVIKRLKQIAPALDSIEPSGTNPAQFIVTIEGDSTTADITNIYNSLMAEPEQDASDLIDRFAKILLPTGDTKIENLVTLIRTPYHFDQLPADAIVAERIVGDLMRVVMEDTPDSIKNVPADHFPNLPMSELFELGTSNVLKSLPDLVFDSSFSPILLCFVDGNASLTSGLLLTNEFWAVVRQKISDDVFVSVPRRDQVFLVDASATNAVTLMKKLITITVEQDYFLLSDLLYRHRNGKLEVVED
jgi:hypothetical protein